MTWQDKIKHAEDRVCDYEKDVAVLKRLQRAWPEDVPVPDAVTVGYKSHDALLVYYPVDEEAGKALLHQLMEAFHIVLPGFVRQHLPHQQKVGAAATCEIGGVPTTLSITSIGPAPTCRLVPLTKMVEQTTWEMVCEDDKEQP